MTITPSETRRDFPVPNICLTTLSSSEKHVYAVGFSQVVLTGGQLENKRSGTKTQLENMPCFEAHNACKVSCDKKSCRQWMKDDASYNCAILCARNGPMTLQQVGDKFNITRMRVCQIEHIIIKKIREILSISD